MPATLRRLGIKKAIQTEDLLQDANIAAIQAARSWGIMTAPLEAWVLTRVRYAVLNHLDRERKQGMTGRDMPTPMVLDIDSLVEEMEKPDMLHDPAFFDIEQLVESTDELSHQTDCERVRRVIEELPRGLRSVIRHHLGMEGYAQMTVSQIARRLRVSVSTVNRRLTAAMEKIHKQMA